MTNMDFNQKLQQLRTQKGLTQEQLAEKVCVSRVAVSKWESGRGYPNLDSLKKLSEIFNISVDEDVIRVGFLGNDKIVVVSTSGVHTYNYKD